MDAQRRTRGKRNEKLQVMLNLEELEAIENWRFANRIGTRSQAIRLLIEIGLRHCLARQRDADDGGLTTAPLSLDDGLVDHNKAPMLERASAD